MHKKLAFIGSVGSGKTTFINNLSTKETLNTDVKSTVDIGKEMTTVGIDYGYVAIDENMTLGLYGVPGQRKFSIIWDFVKEGLWAVVLLIKNKDAKSISELSYLLEYFEITDDTPCIIGITHVDSGSGQFTMNKIKQILEEKQLNLPVYTMDSRLKSSAELALRTLIAIDESN